MSTYLPEKDLEDCTKCYTAGVGCSKEDRPRGVKAVYRRSEEDHRCKETLTCQDSDWTLHDSACYKFFQVEKDYGESVELCNRYDVSIILN